MAALLAVIVVHSAGPVQAQQVLVQLKNLATSFCLDSDTDGDVYTLDCTDDNTFQQWTVENNITTIENFATGLCLDSNFDGNVDTLQCDGSDNQLWNRFDTADGYIFQDLQTGLCLDSNTDQDVYTHDCDLDDFQNSFQIWRGLPPL
jgi:serine/threonine-protein kinase